MGCVRARGVAAQWQRRGVQLRVFAENGGHARKARRGGSFLLALLLDEVVRKEDRAESVLALRREHRRGWCALARRGRCGCAGEGELEARLAHDIDREDHATRAPAPAAEESADTLLRSQAGGGTREQHNNSDRRHINSGRPLQEACALYGPSTCTFPGSGGGDGAWMVAVTGDGAEGGGDRLDWI